LKTIDKAANISMNRRFLISGAIALGAELAARSSEATPVLTPAPSTAVSDGGFRYIAERGSPFSAGVAALEGRVLIRVRLREPLPLEQGLDHVAQHLAAANRPPSALAGLELRAPRVMSRPEFGAFNGRYLAALHAREFLSGDIAPIARSNVALLFDPPKTDVLVAFTYAAPSDARAAGGVDFLLSVRPEYDGSHVVAPGDVSPTGMSRKAGFVVGQLKQSVTALGGHWSDLTGVQIYMTEPLPLVMDVMRDAGLTSVGLSLFPGSAPVVGFDGVRYEFEADVRSIGLERVV
jgi:hypothetical protein